MLGSPPISFGRLLGTVVKRPGLPPFPLVLLVPRNDLIEKLAVLL